MNLFAFLFLFILFSHFFRLFSFLLIRSWVLRSDWIQCRSRYNDRRVRWHHTACTMDGRYYIDRGVIWCTGAYTYDTLGKFRRCICIVWRIKSYFLNLILTYHYHNIFLSKKKGGIDLTITDVRQPPEAFMWGEVKRFCNRNISIRGNVDANDRNLIDLDVRLNEFNNFDLRVLGSIGKHNWLFSTRNVRVCVCESRSTSRTYTTRQKIRIYPCWFNFLVSLFIFVFLLQLRFGNLKILSRSLWQPIR